MKEKEKENKSKRKRTAVVRYPESAAAASLLTFLIKSSLRKKKEDCTVIETFLQVGAHTRNGETGTL